MQYVEVELLEQNKKSEEVAKTYKLAIGTKETVQLEKVLGTDIMGQYLSYMFELIKIQDKVEKGEVTEEEAQGVLHVINSLPMAYISEILFRALGKYDAKMTMDKTYDFIDKYIEQKDEGKLGLIGLVGEIFVNAGFMKGMN